MSSILRGLSAELCPSTYYVLLVWGVVFPAQLGGCLSLVGQEMIAVVKARFIFTAASCLQDSVVLVLWVAISCFLQDDSAVDVYWLEQTTGLNI